MFALQTFLVYSDGTGRAQPPLSDAALVGRSVWLRNNCQACHQFYGFGGFLGPDLTNAIGRLDRTRLDTVLTGGFGQMPAFHLTGADISGVEAYLREMDRTGIGQAKAARPELGAYAQAITRLAMDSVAAGASQFLSGTCTACHGALSARRLGPYLAPDLSVTVARLSDSELDQVLVNGRPELGMPPTGFDQTARNDLAAFLRWQVRHREDIRKAAGGADAAGLPWWEFR